MTTSGNVSLQQSARKNLVDRSISCNMGEVQQEEIYKKISEFKNQSIELKDIQPELIFEIHTKQDKSKPRISLDRFKFADNSSDSINNDSSQVIQRAKCNAPKHLDRSNKSINKNSLEDTFIKAETLDINSIPNSLIKEVKIQNTSSPSKFNDDTCVEQASRSRQKRNTKREISLNLTSGHIFLEAKSHIETPKPSSKTYRTNLVTSFADVSNSNSSEKTNNDKCMIF